MSATPSPLIAVTDSIAELTASETAVWDSFQRFLHCIDISIVGWEATPVVAAVLTLAAVQQQALPPPT